MMRLLSSVIGGKSICSAIAALSSDLTARTIDLFSPRFRSSMTPQPQECEYLRQLQMSYALISVNSQRT